MGKRNKARVATEYVNTAAAGLQAGGEGRYLRRAAAESWGSASPGARGAACDSAWPR